MKHRFLQLIEEQQTEKIRQQRIEAFEKQLEAQKKKAPTDEEKNSLIPPFEIGDQVDVHQRILEGEKERVQVFTGMVIAMRGEGLQAMFTVRRIVQGEGVERIFPVFSPKIARIEVKRSHKVRRAKLYYLRERTGKATRLKERKSKAQKLAEEQKAREAAAAAEAEKAQGRTPRRRPARRRRPGGNQPSKKQQES